MVVLLRLLLLALVSSCAFPSQEKPPPSYENVSSIMLRDVSGLDGGRNIYLKRDGTTYVQRVKPAGEEALFKIPLDKKEVDAFISLLKTHDFLKIEIKDQQLGVVDGGRPSLLVRFASGESKAVAKWEHEKHPDFDPIYAWLLDLAKKAAEGKATREGRYDEKWRPEGFEGTK